MKKLILITFAILSSVQASANVVEKLEFESILEKRLEKGLNQYDKTLNVTVTVGYTKYESMPGTVMDGAENISPDTIDEQDISKILITVRSQLKTIPDTLKSDLFKLVPVPRNRIVVKYEYKEIAVVAVPVAVEPKHLSNNVQTLSQEFAKVFFIGIGAFIALFFVYGYVIHYKNISSFKGKFNELIEALQNSSFGQQSMSSQQKSETPLQSHSKLDTESQQNLNQYPIDSLMELFSDCYWCEEDSYAHWMWKNLNLEHKRSLMNSLKNFKSYVVHFMNTQPLNKMLHDHPYYLQPLNLRNTSQEDLKKEIKKNRQIWNILSPIRQLHMEFPIAEKLTLVASDISEKIDWQFHKSSNFRDLGAVKKIGAISLQDEEVLLHQPDLVPKNWQKNIPTLIWLAQRDAEYITQVLNQYDARALASAWIATPDVLEKLERCLPEKKLKLVKSYITKVAPSKESPVFHDLFMAGISNEAA